MHISILIQQKSYEHVVHVLRHHWFTFLPRIILFIVLILVPVALYFIFNTLFPTLFEGQIIYPIAVLFGSMYYLGILLLFYAQFIEFYLDIMVITNDRAIDVEQHGLFSRSISELDLFRIQDVSTDVHGMFPTLLNYGHITIKTASTNVSLVAVDAPNPNAVREDLIRLAHEDRKYHYAQPGEMGQND